MSIVIPHDCAHVVSASACFLAVSFVVIISWAMFWDIPSMSRSCFSGRLNISDTELTEVIILFAIFVPMPLMRLRAIVSICSWFIIYDFCLRVKGSVFWGKCNSFLERVIVIFGESNSDISSPAEVCSRSCVAFANHRLRGYITITLDGGGAVLYLERVVAFFGESNSSIPSPAEVCSRSYVAFVNHRLRGYAAITLDGGGAAIHELFCGKGRKCVLD